MDLHKDEITGKFYDMALARRVYVFLHPYRMRLIACGVMVLAVTGLELMGPFLIKEMIDVAIAAKSFAGVQRYALTYVGVMVGIFALSYGQQYLLQWVGQRVIFDLRLALFRHLQSLSLGFFGQRPVGQLMTRVMYDVENINELFTSGIVNIVSDIVILVGIMGIMLALNWQMALLTFVTLPLVFYASWIFRRYTITSYRKVRQYSAALSAQLQEAITGMSTVQSFGQEERIFEKFDRQNQLHRDEANRIVFYHAVFMPAITVITGLAYGLIVWYGGSQVVAGALTAGIVFAAFLQYIERLFAPIRDLSEKYSMVQAAMTSAERIFQLLDNRERISQIDAPVPFPREPKPVSFRGVWMSYDQKRWALENISFDVAVGERVAFVGHTGAGKTSLISALTRLYEIQQGEILIGGINTRHFKLDDLRRSVGVVLQEPFMFSGTLMDNIRLGDRSIDEAKIRKVCEELGMDPWVRSLGAGYREVLRERGNNLSTGQKQLIACARVLVQDPKILVLDEATSSMDPQTEWLVRAALRKVMEGRTTLMIAHRLATVQDVQRVIVLQHGKVLEMGTHDQLLKQGGHYAMLYRLQSTPNGR